MEKKYRLVGLKRSTFVSPSNMDKITKANNSYYDVSFKDTNQFLRIRRNTYQRLIADYPHLAVT